MMAQGIHILIITTSINRVRFVTFWYSFWSDFKIVGTLFLRQSLSTMKRLQRKEELFWTNPLNKQLVAKPFFLRSPGAILRCTVTTFLNTVHKLLVISPSWNFPARAELWRFRAEQGHFKFRAKTKLTKEAIFWPWLKMSSKFSNFVHALLWLQPILINFMSPI